MAKDGTKQTYEKLFYHVPKRKYIKDLPQGTTLGFPLSVKAWCNDKLKVRALDSIADTIGGGQNLDSLREQSTDLRTSECLTAQDSSKPDLRILGFPIVKGNWCVSNLKRSVFKKLPCTGSENKYCAISGYCCR